MASWTKVSAILVCPLFFIEKDEYGYCLDCGEPIAPARLQRQPEAAQCVACQSARE